MDAAYSAAAWQPMWTTVAACAFALLRLVFVASLGPGEIFIVRRGVEHQTVAEEETHLLLIEPTGTPNTGDAQMAASRFVI
jgi:hypothetical protein